MKKLSVFSVVILGTLSISIMAQSHEGQTSYGGYSGHQVEEGRPAPTGRYMSRQELEDHRNGVNRPTYVTRRGEFDFETFLRDGVNMFVVNLFTSCDSRYRDLRGDIGTEIVSVYHQMEAEYSDEVARRIRSEFDQLYLGEIGEGELSAEATRILQTAVTNVAPNLVSTAVEDVLNHAAQCD